ncbi:hypothetical protein Tco_0592229, partial [Tanacetum coccineum]
TKVPSGRAAVDLEGEAKKDPPKGSSSLSFEEDCWKHEKCRSLPSCNSLSS